MNIILLITSIFLTIIFSLTNISKLIYKQGISSTNMFLWGLGILGILIHYLGIW